MKFWRAIFAIAFLSFSAVRLRHYDKTKAADCLLTYHRGAG